MKPLIACLLSFACVASLGATRGPVLRRTWSKAEAARLIAYARLANETRRQDQPTPVPIPEPKKFEPITPIPPPLDFGPAPEADEAEKAEGDAAPQRRRQPRGAQLLVIGDPDGCKPCRELESDCHDRLTKCEPKWTFGEDEMIRFVRPFSGIGSKYIRPGESIPKVVLLIDGKQAGSMSGSTLNAESVSRWAVEEAKKRNRSFLE